MHNFQYLDQGMLIQVSSINTFKEVLLIFISIFEVSGNVWLPPK